MPGRFYRIAAQGMSVVIPDAAEPRDLHARYVQELVAGVLAPETRAAFVAVIDRMREHDGIDGVILGGTELPLLFRGVAHPLPFLDTTRIHVDAVVARAFAPPVA
jgi:aspartate racemase